MRANNFVRIYDNTVFLLYIITLLGLLAYVMVGWWNAESIYPKVPDEVEQPRPENLVVKDTIEMRFFFDYLKNIQAHLDSTRNYKITEHQLIQHNDWIINRLEATDYYRLMKKGIFEYDPGKLPVFYKGDTIRIPDSLQIIQLQKQMQQTYIDVNIPEFKLRIMRGKKVLHTFPVRVGQNRTRFLDMAGRELDLRTKTGVGKIVRINKNPRYINPVDNHEYLVTRRDDKRVTKLPYIPWIETEINGIRNGQLIHPTTNPRTLGKAYSNGCIGMNEANAWRTYYNAPIDTKVIIRYDLEVKHPEKDSIIKLKNIYSDDYHIPVADAGEEFCCFCMG